MSFLSGLTNMLNPMNLVNDITGGGGGGGGGGISDLTNQLSGKTLEQNRQMMDSAFDNLDSNMQQQLAFQQKMSQLSNSGEMAKQALKMIQDFMKGTIDNWKPQ